MPETCSSCATNHPKYREMIAAAIQAYKARGGSSRQEILKYITSYYNLGENLTAVKSRLYLTLKAGVKAGSLIRTRGAGANGSFRLSDTSKKKMKGKSEAGVKAESVIQTRSSFRRDKRSKQKNKGKKVQATKQTEAKKHLQVEMSQTTNDPQNMLPQLITLANFHVEEEKAISKAADLQSVNSPENIAVHDPIQVMTFTDNGKVRDASTKNVSSEKSLKITDDMPSPIVESEKVAHKKSCKSSTKYVSSPKSLKNSDDITSPITESEEVAHKKSCNSSTKNVNSPMSLKNSDDITSPITESEEGACKKCCSLQTEIVLEEKVKLRILKQNKKTLCSSHQLHTSNYSRDLKD